MDINITKQTTIRTDNKKIQKMRSKHVIICHSAEEMNRKADALMEQGYQVERETGVQPVQTICFPIFMVKFWR